MEMMAHSVSEAFGGIDVLCANAGIGPMVTIEEMVAEDWDSMMNTNANIFDYGAGDWICRMVALWCQ
ncbi:SDR family NAD(P)-dependent oxidoreductase [Paenibacillus macerans]|uniref:SDR family NAD(P)-dependent oxidoreductase n=1 Tax=Paenibacillus macerans TaxID=44252 RepID=UPI00203B069D|nr:SDR family NAD(P)-dependent oxidoreductase [Paenibacillus macerans]MCM3698710.1 SDR family NAD(P)-dependent oxidoreductase [Paenibacillus macerans]